MPGKKESGKKKGKESVSINKNTPLAKVLELGKACGKCGHCCSHGSGCLAEGDLQRIAKFLNMDENEIKERYLEGIEKFHTTLFRPKLVRLEGKPYGRCVFLTPENQCSVQEVKPMQCRIGNCTEEGEQLNIWFMLKYHLNPKDPESIRQYAVYLRCGGKTLEGFEMENLVKDKKKLEKIMNYEILR